MRSMTGFGTGTASDGRISVTIEMRAVNQRFLELNIRMPHAYLALEDTIRNGIKEQQHYQAYQIVEKPHRASK